MEVEDKINKLEVKMDSILEKINAINSNLVKIEKILTKNTSECEKMGSHIDFVENVYDNVKHPLGFICNKVKYYTGNSEKQYSLNDKN